MTARHSMAVSELGVMAASSPEESSMSGTSMIKKLGGRLGMAGFKRGNTSSTIREDSASPTAAASPTTVKPVSRTLQANNTAGTASRIQARSNIRPASIYDAAQLSIVSPDASKQQRQIQQPGSLGARTASNNMTGAALSPPTTAMRQPGALRHRASTNSLTGSASSATSPPASISSRQPALRHRTSTSSLASGISSSSAATSSLLPPRQRTISTTSNSLLPAPSTTNRSISSSSVRSATTATSSLSNSRRTSYGNTSTVGSAVPARSRTTSTISPPSIANTSLRAVKTSISRVPTSSSSGTSTHRRIGSLQPPAARNTTLSDFTPRPASNQYSSFASSRNNGKHDGSAMSDLEESPGLNELVANTTVQMADLKDMLSPLAVSGAGREGNARRKESWAPGNQDDEDEEEELENIPSPSKPLQRSTTSTASTSLNSSKSSVVTVDPVQIKKQPSLNQDGLSVLPGMKRSPRQHVSLLSPPRATGSRKHLSKQSSDDISAILSNGGSSSPSRFLSAENSTMKMRSDLANVALTPLRPASATSNEQNDKRLAEIEKEKLRAEAATRELEKEKAILEQKYEKQVLEIERLKIVLASQAGDAVRLSKLESMQSTQKHDERAFIRLQEQLKEERQASSLEAKRGKIVDAQTAWRGYEKDLEIERDQINSQRETLMNIREMLVQLEGAARLQRMVVA